MLFGVELWGGALRKVIILTSVFFAKHLIRGYDLIELIRIPLIAIGMELEGDGILAKLYCDLMKAQNLITCLESLTNASRIS